MRRKLSLLIFLGIGTSLLAQPGSKPGYAKLIKISPADSLVTIQPAVKSKLNQLLKDDPGSSRFLFTGADKKATEKISRWLAVRLGRDIYRVDLSVVQSKYIGETEKNLERVFKDAENKNWVLFFDEADALFGKRSNVKDAHDKYANQEVAYLLEHIEGFEGVVLLASNMPTAIDSCLKRHFIKVVASEK